MRILTTASERNSLISGKNSSIDDKFSPQQKTLIDEKFSPQRVRKAYKATGSYNVISLDWEEMASQPW